MSLRNVRGTHDLFGEQVQVFQFIEQQVKQLAHKYCYSEIRTPILEYINVFEKSVGETTDIIGKEMYVFEDRGGEKLVLKPEGTASVIRSVISNGFTHLLPLKYYYISPMFRYERPQKGRQRQFHQVGFEYIGINSPIADVELLLLAVDLLKALKINKYTILINTLGSKESLQNYKKALIGYLLEIKEKLSELSQSRLQSNPLRILDSKDPMDKEAIKNAPIIFDFLSEEDKIHFDCVKKSLDNLQISYKVDPLLVRGLDYYNQTVFEIISDNLGSQGTILAGGRYNHLLEQMGGNNQGCFGFAAGMERLSLLIDKEKTITTKKSLAIIGDNEQNELQFANNIRHNTDISVNIVIGKDIKQKLKKISNDNYFAIIILENNQIKIKNLSSSTYKTIKEEDIIIELLALVNNQN